MSNLFDSMGYSLGKAHAGFLAYLCASDNKENPIFQTLMKELGVESHGPFECQREYSIGSRMRVDLAVFKRHEKTRKAVAYFEIKVDDFEG